MIPDTIRVAHTMRPTKNVLLTRTGGKPIHLNVLDTITIEFPCGLPPVIEEAYAKGMVAVDPRERPVPKRSFRLFGWRIEFHKEPVNLTL